MIDIVKVLQMRELEILKGLVAILDAHGIRYSLAYGTTLGCIRHGGFIPWDDDIDIYVWGKDLVRIKEIFKTENTGFLSLHDYDTVENYPYCFPKVIDSRTSLREKEFEKIDYNCGVYIDIFPLFEVDDNLIIRFFKEKRRYIDYVLLRYYFMNVEERFVPVKLFHFFDRLFFNANKIQHRLFKLYTKPLKNRKLVAEPNIFSSTAYVPELIFKETIKMKFEDSEFCVPKDYIKYLRIVYGDYMKLPPEEKRVSEHKMVNVVIDGISIK